jgi:hypothetical protein
MRFGYSLLSICFASWLLLGCATHQVHSSARAQVTADNFAPSETQTIDTLLRVSATSRLVTGIDHWMIGRIQKQFDSVSETTLMPIFESAMENFAEDNIMSGVKVSVSQHYHSQYMAQLLNWYDSGIGKAYSSRSTQVDTNSAEFKAWFQVADFETPQASLVREILDVSQTLEMIETRMLVPHQGMSMGWQQASRRAGIQAKGYPESSIDTQIVKAQNVAVMCAMYKYRDLSAEQLREIIVFEKSSAARWYYGVIHNGMQNALYQASRRMSEGMTRSVMLRVEREMPKT